MNRRAFLGTLAAGATVTTAGCSNVLGGQTPLSQREPRLDNDGIEKHLVFDHDGERRAVLTIRQRSPLESATDSMGLGFTLSHHHGEDGEKQYENSTVTRFQFDLRAPATSVDPPADVYLTAIGSAGWPVKIEGIDDQWTRIVAEDASEFGSSTITLSTLLDPRGLPLDEVGVRAEIDIENGGGLTSPTYRIDTQTRFEPVLR